MSGTRRSERNLTTAEPHPRRRGGAIDGKQQSLPSPTPPPPVNRKAEKVHVYPMDFHSSPEGTAPAREGEILSLPSSRPSLAAASATHVFGRKASK